MNEIRKYIQLIALYNLIQLYQEVLESKDFNLNKDEIELAENIIKEATEMFYEISGEDNTIKRPVWKNSP